MMCTYLYSSDTCGGCYYCGGLAMEGQSDTDDESENCGHRWRSWLDDDYWSCLKCGDMFYEGPPVEDW